MIKNKCVEIRKKNTYDNGWAVFSPFSTDEPAAKPYSTDIRTLISKITYADEIHLVLSEPCLPRAVVEELKWVTAYAKIELIAKETAIETRYSELRVDSVRIDPSVAFNYIGVIGKQSAYCLIDDGFFSVNDEVENALFSSDAPHGTLDFFADAQSVWFVGKVDGRIRDFCTGRGIVCYQVIRPSEFSKRVKESNDQQKVQTILSDDGVPGIVYRDSAGDSFAVAQISPTLLVPYRIASIYEKTGSALFLNSGLPDTVTGQQMITDGCVWDKGNMKPFHLSREKVIPKTVALSDMRDFIDETFDHSVADTHNRYAYEAREVVFRFTLVPPRVKEKKVSRLYLPLRQRLKNCLDAFSDAQLPKMDEFFRMAHGGENGFSLACAQLFAYKKEIESLIHNNRFGEYNTLAAECSIACKQIAGRTEECFASLYSCFEREESRDKYSRIDAEIAGYQKTITEKEDLVRAQKDVLNNQKRIAHLQKKIQELTELKNRFLKSETARASKGCEAYLERCRSLMEGKQLPTDAERDSVSSVLVKNESRTDMLFEFSERYIPGFAKLIQNISSMERADIPDGYTVYDVGEQKAIIIQAEDEYRATLDLQNRFQVICMTE